MVSRLLTNLVLATVLTGAGVVLLTRESWSLPAKNDPGHALLFHGASLYLLAAALFTLAAFALAVARDRLAGKIPEGSVSHPADKGRILARFWYLVATALLCLALAFALAERVAVTR